MKKSNLNFTVDQKDNLVIFKLNNKKLDAEVSGELKAKFLIYSQPDVEALIIDLSEVQYVDSAGLGALLLARRQMNQYGTPVILVGINENVMNLITISQIQTQFHFFNSIEEAIEALSSED